jgi:hypothetical protein
MAPESIKLFVGYDRKETVAAHVTAWSVVRRASIPVDVRLLMLSQMPALTRPRDPLQSTDFAFSRFLVPYESHYRGVSIFMDCDMLCRVDIARILDAMEPHHAVCVVKHDYSPKSDRKFLNHVQTAYRRKNWSSVVVFNNALCPMLTPEYVNRAPGLDLHQFKWLPDYLIGALDRSWNHLVGEYRHDPDAKIAHFTLGTPCFDEYRACEYADEWFAERDSMLAYERNRSA